VIRFSRLPGFGIEAEGIDLGAQTDDGFAQLQHAFYKHHVLAVRAQSLSPAEFVTFARRLGPFAEHATQTRYQLSFRYGPGDVVVWDNAALEPSPQRSATVLTGRFGSLRGSERFSGADRLRGTRERRFDRRASGSALTHPLIRF
jgi:hypothetical protein